MAIQDRQRNKEEQVNTITVKRSHFGGMVYAECECGYTCHYWEEPEELEHECKGQPEA